MRAAAVLLAFACLCWTQELHRETNFLVKLRTPVGTNISKKAQAVSASVISPETYLGASMEGIVEAVDSSSIRLTFRALKHKGKTLAITSVTTDFVNSKGHKLVDDQERPTRVEGGSFVAAGSPIQIDEGSEMKLRVRPQ
jgi:hypothetical protein